MHCVKRYNGTRFRRFVTATALVAMLAIPGAGGCTVIDVAVLDDSELATPQWARENPDAIPGRYKVVVLPFAVSGAGWGKQFADSISLQLIKSGKFEVVERAALQEVLREQRLQHTGLIDLETGVKIGRLLGARFLILGEATPLRAEDAYGQAVQNLVDTATIQVINVENASNYAIIRKTSGISWDLEYRLKYASFLWDRRELLIESNHYDEIAGQVVRSFIEATHI